MDADTFLAELKETNETALSRLGSSKAVYAETQGSMDPAAVNTASATAHNAAANVFETWAAAEDSAAETWAAAASTEHETVELIDAASRNDSRDPVFDVLAEQETPVERAGAAVGWATAWLATVGQFTGFFVGQADPGTADTYRTIRERLEDQRDRALAVLEDHCDTSQDWTAATEAADVAIEAAYEEYVARLEAEGVNPKPVC